MSQLTLLRPVRGRLVTAVVFQAAASALGMLPLLALVAFVGARVDDDPVPASSVAVAAVIGAVGSVLAASVATWLAHRADADLAWMLQRRLAETIRRSPLPDITGQGAGRIKAVVQDDTGATHYLVAHTMLDVTAFVVTPLVGLVALAVIDWRLAIPALLLPAAGIWCYLRALRDSGARFAEYGAAQQRINAAAVDYVQGLPTAKVYGGPGGARVRFADATSAFHDFFGAWVQSTATVTTASWLIVAPALITSVFVVGGGIAVGADGLAPSAMVAGVLLAPAIGAPVAVVGPRLQAVRSGLAGLTSIEDALSKPVLTWADAEPSPRPGLLATEGVGHSYDGERPALSSFTVELPGHGLVAVVGSSGSGKSTLVSLMARFLDPSEGRLTLGGVDLRDLPEADLYERVGFVFQDTQLRRASVRDVLTGGRTLAAARIEEAARAASVHHDIIGLPHGYDTVLAEDTDLSGGQRQRVSLARALVREPDVLVLDETLSAVDPTTRRALLDTLRAQAAERLVVLVTHQISVAAVADRILVLDDGHLVGDGTHDDLRERCGSYRALAGTGAASATGEDE
ncbi:MAG: ABC transporter ATP-binding protein [Acidimicrobiales bacterium]